SLRKHPKVFDPLYVNLVQAGEVGGILDTILNRLAVYNEKAAKLRRQVRGAMVYPTAVLLIFTAVLRILLGWVIPSFKQIFKDLGSKDDLPALTNMVIAVSEAFVGNLIFVVPAMIGIVIAFLILYRRPRIKRIFHRIFLSVPIVGVVLRKIAVA